MKANDHHQTRLMLPMKTHDHTDACACAHAHAHAHWLAKPHLAHLMSPSIRRKCRGVLARKCEGVDFAGTDKMRALLLMPLQGRSAGKSTCKSTVQVLPCGIHIGIGAQQVGLLESELYRTSHACSDIQLPSPCICPFFLTRTVPLHVSISFRCSPSYSFSLSPSAVSCAPSFPNLFKLSRLYLEAPGGLSESRSLQVVCMHINLANDIAQKHTVLSTHFNNLKFCELRKNSVPAVGTFLPYSEDIKSTWCEFGGRSES